MSRFRDRYRFAWDTLFHPGWPPAAWHGAVSIDGLRIDRWYRFGERIGVVLGTVWRWLTHHR